MSTDVERSWRHYDAGRYDAALELATRALDEPGSDRGQAHLVRAAVFVDRGGRTDAEAALDRAAADASDGVDVAVEVACLRAVLASQSAQVSATTRAVEEAERLGVARPHPRRGPRQLALVESLARVGADDMAWSVCGRLRRETDGEVATTMAKASLHARQGDPKLAVAACRSVCRHPGLPERERWRMYLLRALAERRSEDPAASATAAAAVDRAVELDGVRLLAARDPEVTGRLVNLVGRGGEVAEELDPPPRVEVRLLGDFAIVRGGLAQPPPSATTRQLFGILAVSGGRCPVDDLCGWLWPGQPAKVASARLRDLLRRLRAGMGPLVSRSGDELALTPRVEVDLIEFHREASRILGPDPLVHEEQARALAASACLRYRGHLLPLDPHADWAVGPRIEAANRFRRLAAMRFRHLLEAGRQEDAERFRDHLRSGLFQPPR